MESDGQRLYSVLTRTEVCEKMTKEIVQISDVFSLSLSDATVILIRLGWNSFRASDLLGDDKEKLLSELGLVQVSGSEMIRTDGDGDDLVSTPFCSHKFCSDCWRDYLSESLEEKGKEVGRVMVSCLKRDCVASVGLDTIEKLDETVKEMYERYVLGSFMESNKELLRWCPALGCDYAIERCEDASEDGDESSAVVCLCGHTFCWRCELESHRPVTCNNASLWLNGLLDEARDVALIAKETKPCPHCQSNVQENSDSVSMIVTCHCSYAFCWRCLLSEKDHIGIYRCSEVYVPPRRADAALIGHLALWEEGQEAMDASKNDLDAIERNSIPILTESCGLGEMDMRAVREACMLIVQCRLVLKWSCVFAYFISDYHHARKQYLDHLVEEAKANLLKHKGTVDELIKGAISGEKITSFRHKLETSTTTTGSYFHCFVKTLENGLCDVKADVYENVATDYWFCDRCTFQNDAFEQKCRICVAPFESTPLLALGNSANANQQQVSNVPSNPFARQGGANPFESPPLMTFGNASAHQGGTNLFESTNLVAAFGNNNTAGAPQPQVPNMSNNPFAREGGTKLLESPPLMAFGNSASASAHPNMSNNPFARQGGTNLFESGPVAFGNNSSIGVSAHQQQVPDMASNPFARQGGTFSFPMSPPSVAFGNLSIGASAHQQQDPYMMANNPFAREGGTYPLQSPPFVAFGNNNNNSASAYQQQAPNNRFGRQGGTNPSVPRPVGFRNNNNNNSSASGHQQEARNMRNNPPLARQGGTKPWKLD